MNIQFIEVNNNKDMPSKHLSETDLMNHAKVIQYTARNEFLTQYHLYLPKQIVFES